jgi:triphosphoribosyl-dephospho-CoA synthetase
MGYEYTERPDDPAGRIGQLAVHALLREVAASPKPGLVDRFGSGSHDDMDFMTFADSALALGPSFSACAREGLERGRADPSWAAAGLVRTAGTAAEAGIAGMLASGMLAAGTEAADASFLAALRIIGVQGEKDMLAATGGVNTHKGALFLLGLLAASAGALLGAGIPPAAGRVRRLSARIARGVADRELPAAATHGAAAYRAHGSRGVRGEAESGLSSLDCGALHLLESAAARGKIGDVSSVDALLLLMTVADDTTVLHRGGAAALALVRRSALTALALGGVATESGRKELARMGKEFEEKRISPGGSADLLSAGIFLAETALSFGDRIN